MKPDIGMRTGKTPPPSPTAPDHVLVPTQAALPSHRPAEAARDLNRQLPAAPENGSTVPWPVVVRLGVVAVLLVVAVVQIALGYAAIAAVELILGVGLASVEIIKRWARTADGAP